MNLKFEASKMKQQIKKSGNIFEVKREKKNKFGEKIKDDYETIKKIKGIYHEVSERVVVEEASETIYRTKKKPCLMCCFEDSTGLKFGDIIKFNNKLFKVIDVLNIQEWNIISDICLEVQSNGI